MARLKIIGAVRIFFCSAVVPGLLLAQATIQPALSLGKSPLPESYHPLQIAPAGCRRGEELDFLVRYAISSKEKRYGLKNQTLEPNHGMLFLWRDSKPRVMWMQDTRISLDMLFLSSQGQILQIAAERVPFSLDLVISQRPARAVLELQGGITEKLGIAVGDYVLSEKFPLAQGCR